MCCSLASPGRGVLAENPPPRTPASRPQSRLLSESGGSPEGDWVLGGSLQASANRKERNAGQDLRLLGPPAQPHPWRWGSQCPRAVEGLEDEAVYLVTSLSDPPPHSETRLPSLEPLWDPSRGTEVKAVIGIPRQCLPSSTCDTRGPGPTPTRPHASGPAAPPGTQLPRP